MSTITQLPLSTNNDYVILNKEAKLDLSFVYAIKMDHEVYLNFMVKEKSAGDLFFLQCSVDEEEYETIGFTTIHQNDLKSKFVTLRAILQEGDVRYRLKKLSKNTIRVSTWMLQSSMVALNLN